MLTYSATSEVAQGDDPNPNPPLTTRMTHTSPELERAIAHLQAGYRRLPLELVKTLQEQGFDPESLVERFAR